jgi:hypothetical protein
VHVTPSLNENLLYLYTYIYVCVCVLYISFVTFKMTAIIISIITIFSGSAAQCGLWPPRTTGFRDHTQRRAKVGKTPLDE